MIINGLNSWIIPQNAPEFRHPPRPAELRQPDYEEKFDNSTILYDLFPSQGQETLIGIAPPLLNLEKYFSENNFSSNGQNVPFFVRKMDRICEIYFHNIKFNSSIKFFGDLGNKTLKPSPNMSDVFRGRRVLMTASRDNKLEWIEDWIRFNVSVHSADAVLVYDNGSTAYSIDDLHDCISHVPGIRAVAVVRWPFKWGPSGAGTRWDSNFCQLGAWQHARRRFLAEARSVLNADIDELVLTKDGRSVFEIVEQAPTGYVQFPGQWVVNISSDQPSSSWELRRHRDFNVRIKPGVADCETKWAVVPWRCPVDSQWGAHAISSLKSGAVQENVSYRHFRAISLSWKYDRESPVSYDAERHERDDLLIARMAAASKF
ncbi:hypothetical protein [Teichococcus rhizosphaerae]|uniref:hypothetical protein n=1 Tax=Teichococcus rhizosphaerae TaxID=1335062 RepID=UPI00114530CA|nr:hypothetical protein [Pseudoroseomonas rhizosphaerae]